AKGGDMVNAWARDRATLFYAGFGLFALAVAVTGFSTTYIAPMARRTFSAPWFVHVHGAACVSWIGLVIVQSMLVRRRRTPLHRRLGQAAIPVALILWSAGIATQLWATKRDLPTLGPVAASSLLGTISGLSLYLLLVIAAIVWRRRPDWHKRLIVLATIQVLWPAFFRLRHLLPMVPKPEISLALVLAYSPILVAALRDKLRYGRIHPVWLFVAPALVIEQSLEVALFGIAPWQRAGAWVYAQLG
ncbi:MAG: hypothetical protein ABIO80_07905, partial [Sphingomicrobium sp.]